MKKPELLAPAGTLEKLKFAVQYGADAVYIAGKQYGLRAFAGNFTSEQMAEGIAFAHQRQVKVYVTVNVFAHNADFDGLEAYLQELLAFRGRCHYRVGPGHYSYCTADSAGFACTCQHPSQCDQLVSSTVLERHGR